MEHQTITEPIKPFAQSEHFNYYLYQGEVYRMLRINENTTSYDLITGLPLSVRWECTELHFNQYKSVYVPES
jgi:hypothetical protein